jgi:hypothetical protein
MIGKRIADTSVSTGFRVDSLLKDPKRKAACKTCSWSGKSSDLKEIGGCSLVAGNEVPAGRCPECSGLVRYESDQPEVIDAILLLARLVEYDERLKKGRSVDGDDYASTLREAKRAAKKALGLLESKRTESTETGENP